MGENCYNIGMRYNRSMFVNNTLRVAITNVCGVDGLGDKDAKHMTLDTARAIGDFVRANKIRLRELHITGGEPLLHPQCMEIISILKQACFEGVDPETYLINVDANATLLTEEKIDTLKKIGVCQMTLGVDEYNGQILNPGKKKFREGEMPDLLNYCREEMEITYIHRLILDDANIANCVMFKDRLDIPSPDKSKNYGCLTIGNIPLGSSAMARLFRYKHKKDYEITDEEGYKHSMKREHDDYRDNVTTYLQEFKKVKAKHRKQDTAGLDIVELSPDFTTFAKTDVGYNTVDIDGNINLCKMSNVALSDNRLDNSENYETLPSTNVRRLKITFDKQKSEDGVVTITPTYSTKYKRKESMGE